MFSMLLSKYAPTQKALWEMNIFGTKMKKRCGSINLKQWEDQKKQNHWVRKALFSDSFPQTNFFIFLLLISHIPVEQLEADGRWTRVTADKVTGRKTWRLSSYLCTPSGSQQRKHWCQTGRSSTGCWTCCSAVVVLLYLHYTIHRRQLKFTWAYIAPKL